MDLTKDNLKKLGLADDFLFVAALSVFEQSDKPLGCFAVRDSTDEVELGKGSAEGAITFFGFFILFFSLLGKQHDATKVEHRCMINLTGSCRPVQEKVTRAQGSA